MIRRKPIRMAKRLGDPYSNDTNLKNLKATTTVRRPWVMVLIFLLLLSAFAGWFYLSVLFPIFIGEISIFGYLCEGKKPENILLFCECVVTPITLLASYITVGCIIGKKLVTTLRLGASRPKYFLLSSVLLKLFYCC